MSLFTTLQRDDPVLQASACTSLEELKALLAQRSGYAREAAIDRVMALGGDGAIPAIMPRLNDFVPEVRAAARRAIQALLPSAGHEDLLAVVGFTWRLRHFSRLNHSAWISSAQAELARRLTFDQLREALCSRHPMVARGSFFMLLERELIPRVELLTLAVESGKDIVMSRQAAVLALSLLEEDRIAVLRGGMKSHFGVVRTHALRGLLGCAPDAAEIARGALLDPQGSARSLAQYYLRSNGVDLAPYYRELLQDRHARTNQACMALAALGSMGGAGDIALLREMSESPFPSIRGAAFLAWLKLAPSDKDAIALAALSDEGRANRRLAAQMATRQGAYVPFERVKEVLRDKADLSILLAFARLRKWDWLETIALEAAQAERGSMAWDALHIDMVRWLAHAGHSYERPDERQRDRLLAPGMVQALERLFDGSRDVLHYELDLIAKC
ncbi:hypothetical protein [Pseudoduganella sp. R-43]|uniref:hypothetical protein n=1 Tax=Pseudoduganella sp. R-43 TaxID=3404063 RepID=UPI003CEE3D6A